MKRISVLAAAACAALLASCGSTAVQESRAETSTPQTTTQQTVTTTVTAVTEDETQAEPEELYDTSAISAAYLSGDTSGLDEFQMEIYERAVQVMEEVLTEDMTDYEKELAIHDYIVANITYDVDNLSVFETHG
ncbi:MAG: transglutaminase, partial [Ruminococcus sp.]|nr:transglutaminase [Ruminococcus sp.]